MTTLRCARACRPSSTVSRASSTRARAAARKSTCGRSLRRVEPDVVLLDYHLPRGDGLQLCYRIKQHIPAPKVIFSAYAGPELMLPAQLAHADGLLSKGTGARELFETIRRVAEGERRPIARSLACCWTALRKPTSARRWGWRSRTRHAVQRTLSALGQSAPVAG